MLKHEGMLFSERLVELYFKYFENYWFSGFLRSFSCIFIIFSLVSM